MSTIKQQITEINQRFNELITAANDADALEKIRIDFLGRKGKLTDLMQALKALSQDEKRDIGPLLNNLKVELEALYSKKKIELESNQYQQEAESKSNFDVTSYMPNTLRGSLHPYTYITEIIENVFITMGYEIADGPEMEKEFYNFEALNIPSDHPARDMQDTIWLEMPQMLMRTHTSSVQIHTMQNTKPPLAIVAPGRAYRFEATDASHDYVFKQCEGLLVGKDISMANLLATTKTFLQAIFEKEELVLRVRPGYFPFVEPGIEIDIQCIFCKKGCSTCKQSRWIECMGAGLVNPHVLSHCNIDSLEYSGFAFGFGLTRLAMLKYGINDIRMLHNNSVEFLEQF
ncbi:phenylalanine--tRNA ligase subunit alpha [candidate division TM6 bacterium RIFCSPHIGHO2_12_FULL_36_22]|nr:MAG: phenylalanine--tRNA ligase subunit alpha [candidate division TM6 bacterium RIFCSPHIGHO2_12_FULL_36_22]